MGQPRGLLRLSSQTGVRQASAEHLTYGGISACSTDTDPA